MLCKVSFWKCVLVWPLKLFKNPGRKLWVFVSVAAREYARLEFLNGYNGLLAAGCAIGALPGFQSRGFGRVLH